ncbi:MAG: hypothetical protein VKJ66_00780 [Synechococcus sp.]|nr:hypothetical protein [Synechococcus sp.]
MTLLDARRARLALIEQVEASNGQRYRALALYLQVLREGLLKVIQQACFHLATQVLPQRYAALPQRQRRELHSRLRRLVHRCGSLLTVEQLAALAHQQAGERIQRRQQRQTRLLQTLQHSAESPAAPPQGALEADLPQGSIRLGFDLPLSTPLGEASGPFRSALFSAFPQEDDPDSGEHSPPDRPQETLEPEGEESESLLSAFGQLLEASLRGADAHEREPEESQEPPGEAEEEEEMGLAGGAGIPDPFAPAGGFDTSRLWNQGRLPGDPVALLFWFDGIEAALARRLRNLSHAINVELLRLGLTRSLLPVSLLDAILQGQVDTLPAGPNLVRLALPMPDPSGRGSLESIALLLRVADLEMELPALRTCRRKLQQLRQEDRRMAEQFRRVERRLQVLEAEALWLEDNRHDEPGQEPETGPLP